MELDASFENDLKEQLLDATEESLEAEDSVVSEAIRRSHNRLEAVASRNGYDVENVVNSLEGPGIVRERNRIVVRWGWTHEAANYFGRGTESHTVQGNPTLSFIWVGAPQEIVAQFSERWDPSPRVFFSEVEVEGIEQSRFARHGLEWLRHELESEGL